MQYLKQEGEQSYTRHIMFCLCQRAVRFLDVDYMQLDGQKRVTVRKKKEAKNVFQYNTIVSIATNDVSTVSSVTYLHWESLSIDGVL